MRPAAFLLFGLLALAGAVLMECGRFLEKTWPTFGDFDL